MSSVIDTPPGIAFFDLDRTLISVNSASGWIRRELRLGFVTRWQAAKAVGWVGLYHLGFGEMQDVIRQAIGTLEGDREAVIRARTQAFFDEEIAATIRPGAAACIARHRARGEAIVLLTSSSNYMSEATAELLDVDDWLCNRFEVEGGVFTGRSATEPLCFGAGKVDHAEAYASARGLSLSDCAFYTDSHSDLPVLERVGRPVVVAPDPRLRRVAVQREWPIESWDERG